jgi:hypothetical protein
VCEYVLCCVDACRSCTADHVCGCVCVLQMVWCALLTSLTSIIGDAKTSKSLDWFVKVRRSVAL